MKTSFDAPRRPLLAFTLVELLTVIAIIALLAAMLFPVIGRARRSAQVTRAQSEMQQIASAINNYHSLYSRYPVSSNVMQFASVRDANRPADFSFGARLDNGTNLGTTVDFPIANSIVTNDEVIAILMDLTNYPGSGLPTANMHHVKNPRQNKFLNASIVSEVDLPGVGPDLVYRDPWGTPYIITMDLNYDDRTRDPFYARELVSQQTNRSGFNGLNNPVDTDGNGNNFFYSGGVMVWSAGPDKQVNGQGPADQGVNKDNVIGWK